MSKSRKVLRTLAVVGVLAALAGVGAFSVFSDFTDNENNQVTAGTVNIDDNDGGTALYNFTNAKPGQSAAARCIRVDYTGTLPANVKLYTTSTIGALGAQRQPQGRSGNARDLRRGLHGLHLAADAVRCGLEHVPHHLRGRGVGLPERRDLVGER